MPKKIDLSKILGVNKPASTQVLTLYIPDRDREGNKIRNLNKWIKEAQRVLTMIGGGSTMMPPADGTWLDPEKNINDPEKIKDEDLVWEKTRIIYTYIDPDKFENNLNRLKKFLHSFGRETNQGEVVFEFDGMLYRIDEYDQHK